MDVARQDDEVVDLLGGDEVQDAAACGRVAVPGVDLQHWHAWRRDRCEHDLLSQEAPGRAATLQAGSQYIGTQAFNSHQLTAVRHPLRWHFEPHTFITNRVAPGIDDIPR